MAVNLNFGMAKEKMDQFLKHAKSEAETFANEKLVPGLKKIGLATRSEVEGLEKRVEELAAELREEIGKASRTKSSSTKSSKSTDASY